MRTKALLVPAGGGVVYCLQTPDFLYNFFGIFLYNLRHQTLLSRGIIASGDCNAKSWREKEM
jgi:hypothetical protein